MPFVTILQVGNRQKDTLQKLQAFTQKLRTSTQKQQQQDKAAAAAATKAAQEAAAVQQQEAADEAAAAAASKQEAANGSGDKAAGGADEAYAGKVGCAGVICLLSWADTACCVLSLYVCAWRFMPCPASIGAVHVHVSGVESWDQGTDMHSCVQGQRLRVVSVMCGGVLLAVCRSDRTSTTGPTCLLPGVSMST